MEQLKHAFLALPDTVIITDKYLNILDFNHAGPFENLERNAKLTAYMPDFAGIGVTDIRISSKIYRQKISAVEQRGVLVGFTVYLSDITDKVRLLEQNRRTSGELEWLIEKQRAANAELSEYVRQAQAIIDAEEQRRIAHNIHDNAGHAITALHTISQMCLRLRNTDKKQYEKLLAEGIDLCERALEVKQARQYRSLCALLEEFQLESPIPIDISVSGEEPTFAAGLYETVHAVCKEALHNTLAHSLADRQFIRVGVSRRQLILRIADNGQFHGTLEKGFGLHAMEKTVQNTGGTICFHAAEGEGFEITVRWRVHM